MICCECGRTVSPKGEGVWFGPEGKMMCPSCASEQIKVESTLLWNSEKGCYDQVEAL